MRSCNPQAQGNAKEVLRYRQALWSEFNDIKSTGCFSTDMIIRIYQKTKDVRDGIRPPQTETVIKRRGSGNLGGTVVYTPPRGEKVIREKLENLVSYLKYEKKFI